MWMAASRRRSDVAHAVIMGVAGCGKSSVGQALAKRFGRSYVEGDALHPDANIAKMSAGIPLEDEDRWPWLDRIAASMAEASEPQFVGCSALKRAYRDRVRGGAGGQTVVFVHLAAPRDVIANRMDAREGHFMPLSLLDSQFAALEPLEQDEAGTVIDIDQPLESVIEASVAYMKGITA